MGFFTLKTEQTLRRGTVTVVYQDLTRIQTTLTGRLRQTRPPINHVPPTLTSSVGGTRCPWTSLSKPPISKLKNKFRGDVIENDRKCRTSQYIGDIWNQMRNFIPTTVIERVPHLSNSLYCTLFTYRDPTESSDDYSPSTTLITLLLFVTM